VTQGSVQFLTQFSAGERGFFNCHQACASTAHESIQDPELIVALRRNCGNVKSGAADASDERRAALGV